jgi:formamidopyrimidine-DNA glycosylase
MNMPELPEVETVVQELILSKLIGKTIVGVEVLWPKTVLPSPKQFIEQLSGLAIKTVKRRGKYIVFSLSGSNFLYVHLRMTGRFSFTPTLHARLILHLSDGRTLYYNDPRKFGRWTLTKDPAHLEQKLGLEPLESSFTLEAFKQILASRGRQIKPLLLDQQLIVGLGNIYVDEALWFAKIHPQTPSNVLLTPEVKDLHAGIIHVLKRGLETKGTTLGKGKSNFYRVDGSQGTHQDILYAFRRTGLPCPRCKTPIQRIIVAQRSSHLCPTCQVYREA